MWQLTGLWMLGLLQVAGKLQIPQMIVGPQTLMSLILTLHSVMISALAMSDIPLQQRYQLFMARLRRRRR